MSVKYDKLPAIVQKRIDTIVKKIGITKAEVMVKYKEILNMDFIANAPSQEFKYEWASQKLHSDFFSKLPLKKRNIIFLNAAPVSKFAGRDADQVIFFYDLDSEKIMSAKADTSGFKVVAELTAGEYYPEIEFGVTEHNTFTVDDRTVVPEPEAYFGIDDDYPADIVDLLDSVVEVKPVKMKDFGNAKLLSKKAEFKDNNGKTNYYTDKTDWRCIKNCMIIKSGVQDVQGVEGAKKGNLLITDSSIADAITTDKGITINNRMTIWVSADDVYPPYSAINIYGPIEMKKRKIKDRDNPGKEIEQVNFNCNGFHIEVLGRGPEEES